MDGDPPNQLLHPYVYNIAGRTPAYNSLGRNPQRTLITLNEIRIVLTLHLLFQRVAEPELVFVQFDLALDKGAANIQAGVVEQWCRHP